MIQLLILALLPLSTLAESKLGCYSSLPSSYTDKSTYEYQSSAHCSSQCSDYSYFALEGGNTCICGNTAPSGSQSSDCDTPCYGYGEETCGGDGVYDFYAIGNGGSSGSSSVNSATSSTEGSTSSTADSTTSSTTSSSTGTTSTKQSTTTGTSSTTTAVSTSSADGTTIVIMSTVAASQSSSTASSSDSASSTSSTAAASSSSSGSSGSSDNKKKTSLVGPVVGGVVGGIAAIALISVLFFFLRRRSSAKHDAELADSAYFNAVKRDNSTLTRPLSNPFLSKEDFTDQRLNPVMLGRRRISEGSLADEADYSRKILRVANPDDDL